MSARATTTVRYHPWSTCMWASEEARRQGARRAGTDHLLLGLLEEPVIQSALGVTLEEARARHDQLDREALDALGLAEGVDAPPLRMHPIPSRPTFRALIADRLSTTPAAKAQLKALGKPVRRGHRVTPEDVLEPLLALEYPDPAAELLAALGVDKAEVRRRVSAAPRST